MPIRTVCVSCGKIGIGNNHKCSNHHEGGIKAAQTAANNKELRLQFTPKELTLNQRLAIGFQMLGSEE
jgi:hypothetical protein